MPAKTVNDQFSLPIQGINPQVIQPIQQQVVARQAQETSARLHLQELFSTNTKPQITIETAAYVSDNRGHATPENRQMSFADIEPFLFEVGDWLEFDRKEVENNGRPR